MDNEPTRFNNKQTDSVGLQHCVSDSGSGRFIWVVNREPRFYYPWYDAGYIWMSDKIVWIV